MADMTEVKTEGTVENGKGGAPKRAARRKASKPTVVTAPEVPGVTARTVVGFLERLQGKRAELEVQMVANNHGPDDPFPQRFSPGDTAPRTYRDELNDVDEAEKRIVKAYESVMPEVEKLLEQAKQQAGMV